MEHIPAACHKFQWSDDVRSMYSVLAGVTECKIVYNLYYLFGLTCDTFTQIPTQTVDI